jgi:hypothetical protein
MPSNSSNSVMYKLTQYLSVSSSINSKNERSAVIVPTGDCLHWNKPPTPYSACQSAFRVPPFRNETILTGTSRCAYRETQVVPSPNCSLVTPTTRSAYFKVMGNDQCIVASSERSNYNTFLAVYQGSQCDDRQCVVQDDDVVLADGSTLPHAMVSWWAEQGTSYYILLGGIEDSMGDFRLNLTVCMNVHDIPIVCWQQSMVHHLCVYFLLPFRKRKHALVATTTMARPDPIAQALLS